MSPSIARVLALLLVAGCGPVSPFEEGEGSPGHAEPDSLADAKAESNGVDRGLLVDAPKRTTRTIAAMMFDIGGGPPDAADIQELLTGEDSLRQMYLEISYGMQDLSIDLLGPYTLPEQTCLPIECCGPKTGQPNGPAVQEIIAGLPKTYDHYFWVYGRIPQGANCGTWGDQGRPGQYAKYTSYSFHSIVGYTQELGHNFGMTHEPIMNCPGNATFVDDPSDCTHSEYGSQLSFMGSGPMHTSGYHKVAQGWLSGCNGVTVGGSGTYTLLPTEIPCDGVQILQIEAPKSRSAAAAGDRQGQASTLTHYYLELRTPRSFDARYPNPQVFISVGPDFNTTRTAPYVYQLNRTPTDTNNRPSLSDGGYTTGQMFADPAGGLTFTFDSVTTDQATVTVTRTAAGGSDTCLNDMPFTGPGPGPDSCGLPVPPGTGGAAGAAGMGGGAGTGAGAGGVSTAGAAGMPGAGGVPAAGGSAGAAGAATGGSAGTGASAGSGATGGSAGAATGGSGGTAGAATGGSTSGGAPGAGTGGSSTAGAGAAPPGSGGTAGAGVGGGADAGSTELKGGCGCRVAGDRRSDASLAGFGALAVALAFARRRRRAAF